MINMEDKLSEMRDISDYSPKEEEFLKPFTFLSLELLDERDNYLKEIELKRAKHAQEAHLVDGELKFGSPGDEDRLPPENPDLIDGSLFTKDYGSMFPKQFLRIPLEEMDPGIRDKTFVVISSRFRKKYITRYTASYSLFLFAPWNPVRKATVYLCTHQFFDLFIFTTIIINCIFLAAPSLPGAENLEYLFMSVYSFECFVKVVARGFILNNYTYLRDPWNWLDFTVINTAFLTVVLHSFFGIERRNLTVLRTFRVLRVLKTVSIVPGLKTIVSALLRAFKMLFEVLLLTLFCLMVFAIFGIELYMGSLRQKCVIKVSGYSENPSESYHDYYIRWVRNLNHWYQNNNEYTVCGNNTGAGLCPHGYVCLPNIGENPRYGFLNFDHFGWALLSCFQLITLDFWEDVYMKVLSSTGPWNVFYFIITIFFGAFYLINLMLAVVSLSYEEEAVSAIKEKEREKKENARKKHNALYDISYLQMKAKFEAKAQVQEPSAVITDTNVSARNSDWSTYIENRNIDTFVPSKFTVVSTTGMTYKQKSNNDNSQIIKADTLLNPDISYYGENVIDRNWDCCEKWICKYSVLLRAQNYVYVFVSDPLFELFITFCIVLNTVFLSLEHHEQSQYFTITLEVANTVFTAIFALEAALKIFGMGKYYFFVGWNIFDLITVGAGILDFFMEQVGGLSILRTLRLLRVFKLAQSWPTMRLLLTIILSTLGALGNLCVVLCIVIYIFAVIGLQLFQSRYETMGDHFTESSRWNFSDFYHSMLMIFRVLCGEWIEPLYACMQATDEICMVIFLPSLVFGNFIVLNLFLALLLNAFASDSLDKRDTNSERSKLAEGIHRLKQLLCCCFTFNTAKLHSISEAADLTSSESFTTIDPPNSVSTSPTATKSKRASAAFNKNENKSVNPDECEAQYCNTRANFDSSLDNYNNNAYRQEVSSEYSEGVDSSTGTENEVTEQPPDCFPSFCPRRLLCSDPNMDRDINTKWRLLRSKAYKVVSDKMFDFVIMIMILTSSLELAFEDIYLYEKPVLSFLLKGGNMAFAILFTLEMIVRWIGIGFTKYFTNLWTLLDFFIVLTSLMTIVGDVIGLGQIQAFKSLRTLRSLRPLRAISRWQGMKIVVNALMNAIPAIMNVFLVCMVFWLIFSIMGVQFFKGMFYQCIDPISLDVYIYTVVDTRSDCAAINGSWANPNVNFDNAINGFLALFQVEGHQPRFEARPLSYVYFVVFIVFGSFFSMNLFIGVIIDNFNVLKKKYEGSYLDAFLSQNQRYYYNTLKKLAKKKPQKSIRRPKKTVQLLFYNLAMSNRFEMGMVLIILCNMIGMTIGHYRETVAVTEALDMLQMGVTFVFTLEAVMKIIGLEANYFRVSWNVFDFIVVILSIMNVLKKPLRGFYLGMILNEVMSRFHVSPPLLRILHAFRIGSILRLIKAAKGIRKLLYALVISLPAIVNIGALLFLIMFMYAILGMSTFGSVKLNGILDEVVNFQTFGNSFMLLLRLATSAGWNDVLDALLIQAPYCNPDFYTLPDGTIMQSINGDCGVPYLAIPFMVSYIIIVWMIVINMYIAVILENFHQAHEQEEVGITEDDFDMFYNVWERFDPMATQFIKFEELADFVGDLEPPLQLPKPNEITLVSFNLPILEGDKVHCLDILVALVSHVLSDVQESEELKTLKEQMELKFSQNFPSRFNIVVTSSTLQRKKEDVAARTLQRSWRSFKAHRAMRNITALAVQNKIRRNSHLCLRSRTSVITNLSNRVSIALEQYFTLLEDSPGDSNSVDLPSVIPQYTLSHEDLLRLNVESPFKDGTRKATKSELILMALQDIND